MSDDLEIYTGSVRAFEWYWDENDEMRGLDAFNDLDDDGKAAVMATLEHWGDLELGKRVSATRINEERGEPKILAVKAGKHRFAMFHAGNNLWIVCDYYRKQKEKLDKVGRAAIERAIMKKQIYERRVQAGGYYERE